MREGRSLVVAGLMLQACSMGNVPPRASAKFVESRPSPVEAPREPVVARTVPEDEPTWPRTLVPPKQESALPPVRPAPVCVGDATLPKEKPHHAACCYPAREALARPIRAVFPELRACYEHARDADAEGTVVFKFRVERDGVIRRVCGQADTPQLDDDVVRCMAERFRTIRYEARTEDDVALCGLIEISYPVRFTHEGN